jgi:integrase
MSQKHYLNNYPSSVQLALTGNKSKPRTHKRYEVASKPLLACFGKVPLDAISAGQVEKFKIGRAEKISPAGVNRELAALRFMLNFGVRQGHVLSNPVNGIRFLPEGPGAMRVVSHEEQQRYLAAASQPLRDVALLIVETGMSPEEVFTMLKENLHLDRRYIFVPSGKTRFRRRNVPLTQATESMLKLRLAKARGPYLFPNRLDPNKPLTTVHKGHLEALVKAKIRQPFRLYDLRHTFGSRSAMAGVDLSTLKELMGHSSISTTMRYVHPTPEHKRQAVGKLEQFNAEQIFALYEGHAGSPQNPPQ